MKFVLEIQEKGYDKDKGMLWNIVLHGYKDDNKVSVTSSPDYTIDQVTPALKMYSMMLDILRSVKKH